MTLCSRIFFEIKSKRCLLKKNNTAAFIFTVTGGNNRLCRFDWFNFELLYRGKLVLGPILAMRHLQEHESVGVPLEVTLDTRSWLIMRT